MAAFKQVMNLKGLGTHIADVDVKSGGTVPLANLHPAGPVQVNDTIIDANGDAYTITAVTGENVTVGDAIPNVSFKGPKGDGADVGVATGEKAGIVKPGTDFDITGDGTISLYKPIQITRFDGGTTVELGSTVDDVTLTWDYNKEPATLQLDKTDVTKTDGLFDKTRKLTKLGLKTNKTWTLVATDARGASSTKTTGVSFKLKRYWGVGKPANANAIDSAFILGLEGGELSDNRVKDFTVTATDGNYILYAIPASYGTPVFYVGGFEGGFNLVRTFDLTNASGHVESYNVYQSGNANLGKTTVNVK